MGAITARLIGGRTFRRKAAGYEARVRREVARVVIKYTFAVERDSKLAAPVDTGFLRANIRSDVRRAVTDLVALVISGAEYSSFVEFGTARMDAKPFLFPAVEANRRAFYEDLKAAVRGARR